MPNGNQADAVSWSSMATDHPMPTIARQRVIGEKVMISRVVLSRGCIVRTHVHENEQIACVISGRLRFGLGKEGTPAWREVVAVGGDVVHLPSMLPHSAEALEETVVLDVFAPPSEGTGIDSKR